MSEKKSPVKLHTFEEVKDQYFVYITDPKDRQRIEKAYLFACKAHEGQFRKSGEPYIHHLIEVCYILTTLQCGPSTLIAGLLHDTVEDTNVTLDEIKSLFGQDVMNLVDSLTKIQRLKLSHRDEEEFVYEDHRKIFLGMAKDVRVIVIKLADRLHNMRTLSALSEERQKVLSRETLEVFVPIAHRLGMNSVKSELEDLSLKYLEPEKYEKIIKLVDQKVRNASKSLDTMAKKIADDLFEKKIPFELKSRVKSIYSIYRKIYQKHHKFEEIFDILALRIITETELNCYEILGIIHATYTPVLGRFKDYIATPKPNMYQSLHTCILDGNGNTFEVQIRTKEMDETAESGIAAHWRYKEGSKYDPKKEQKEIEEKLYWLRDFVNMSDNKEVDAKEYMDSLSHDIFEANVYVFTPMGKVINLPSGATPLDFAYKIHTGVAEKAVGAIVNNVMVPLNTVLKTGDIVEIKTSKSSPGPNVDWLNIVATNFAKNHIRKFLAKKNAEFMRDDIIQKGKNGCLEAFKAYGIGEEEMEKMLSSEKVLENYHASSLEDLYKKTASRNPSPGGIIDFLNIRKPTTEIMSTSKVVKDSDKTPVYVPGAGKVAITLGNCCTPIPGDEIVGYITKGKGVTIHRKDCPNIANEKKRLIAVSWKENLQSSTYPVDLKIECHDRANLIVEIMQVFAQKKIPVTSLNATFHNQTLTTTVAVTIYVANADALHDAINLLSGLKSVYEITRATH